jgi:hypothetical protein
MHSSYWRVAPLVLLVASACGPVVPTTCTPENCADGCCDSAGVCVAGRTIFACGLGGATCAMCEPTQTCNAGACTTPMDAGFDGGVDAGEADAGWDAGTRRTVTFTRTPHIRFPNGTEQSNPNALGGSTVTLFYESPGGEWFTAPSMPDPTEVRFDQVPEGDYVIDLLRPNSAHLLYVSDAPTLNVGPKIAGRRSASYSAVTLLVVDAGVGTTGRPPDSLGLSSFTAGFVRDSTVTTRSGAESLRASADLSTGTFPFTLNAGDDLTLVLNRSVTDSGVTVTSTLMGTEVAAPAITTGQTVQLAVTLSDLPRESATVGLASSEYAQFISEVNPMATANSHRLIVSKSFTDESLDGGGDFDGRSMALLQVTAGSADFTSELDWGNPFPSANHPTLVRATQSASLVFTLQGRTTTRGFDALVTQRFARDTTMLRPALSPPRFVRLNGATAFVDRNGVSTTPTLEWTAPSLGQPTQYSVNVYRVVTSGTALSQQLVFLAITPRTRLRIPPGLLMSGEVYFALVTAQRVRANDVRLTPNRTSKTLDEVTAITSLFAP